MSESVTTSGSEERHAGVSGPQADAVRDEGTVEVVDERVDDEEEVGGGEECLGGDSLGYDGRHSSGRGGRGVV